MEYTREYRIRSSWNVKAAAGEPFASVRVRNLQTTVQAAQDAWGREGKVQPLLVSADLSLSSPFEASSAGDKLAADTVHYGTLGKAILAALECYHPWQQPPPPPPPPPLQLQQQQQELPLPLPPLVSLVSGTAETGSGGGSSGKNATSLRGVLETVWSYLTGLRIDGIPRKSSNRDERPFLDISRLRSLSITVTLPKASLLGAGVSLTATSVFRREGHDREPTAAMFGVCLNLKGLRVPTLIGVNANERLAKQVVVADIEIDKFDYAPDVYTELEALVVKTMEESSFETLEALGSHLASKIMAEFKPLPVQTYSGYFGWQIKIGLEKPIAIAFADGPCVEIRAGAGGPQDTDRFVP